MELPSEIWECDKERQPYALIPITPHILLTHASSIFSYPTGLHILIEPEQIEYLHKLKCVSIRPINSVQRFPNGLVATETITDVDSLF
jgi:hypothetical protein